MSAVASSPLQLEIVNNSQKTEFEGKKNWYKWEIHLEGDENSLNRVNKVIYHLHPSFAENKIVTTDRKNNFRHETIGWGMFEVGVEIYHDNLSIPIKTSHYLSFYKTKRTEVSE